MGQITNNEPQDIKANKSMITLDFLMDKYSIYWHKVVHNKTDCQTIWQTIFPERLEKIKHNYIWFTRDTHI